MFNLNSLNDMQLKAVQTLNGPVLVVAGAGSGKTRALTFRIYNLVANHGVRAENILAITFTNKATNEMKERLTGQISGTPQISTFHAFCAKILRENIHNLDGYNRYFSIYADDDRNKVLKKIVEQLNVSDKEYYKELGKHISVAKNMGLKSNEYFNLHSYLRDSDILLKGFNLYEQQLKNNNALDFDDLLSKTHLLLSENEMVLNRLQDQFKYIHVDEFQDTNIVQYKVLKLLASKHGNIFVVGDEDQCIYGWRGASIENTRNYINEFKPIIIKLEQNYRSTKQILDHANKLISYNTERIDKNLWTNNTDQEKVHYYMAYNDGNEADYVVRNIYNLINVAKINPSSIAILFRMGALSRQYEERLLSYNLPYVVYGAFKFYERAEIKNILSYLWLVYNTQDNESIKRIINFPKRGIGQTSINDLEKIASENGSSIYEVILNSENYNLKKALATKLQPFKVFLWELKEFVKKETSASAILNFILEFNKIKEQYDEKNEDDYNRILNIGQLVESVKDYENLNLNSQLIDFLQAVTLQSEIEETDVNESVRVSTVHAVKGLEFDAVFVVGAEEGIFPISRSMTSEKDIEEERRLMYVAVTRSRKYLTISSSDSRFLYNERKYMKPSRFLTEMGLIKEKVKEVVPEFNFGAVNMGHYGIKSSTGMNNYAQNNVQNNTKMQQVFDQKVKNQTKDFSQFVVSAMVLHPKFGIGEIVETNIEKGNNSVVVQFKVFGVKTLNLDIAPLQVVAKK